MVLVADSNHAILNTGDFRYRPQIVEHVKQVLGSRTLTHIYLDNTFATTSENFPSQQEAYTQLVNYIESKRQTDKALKFYIYCYTLGKEEVFFNLAEHFKTKIRVDKDRYNKLKAIGMGESYFVTK